GEGGMGEVWRADHAFLARPAAVKIIRPAVLGGLDGDADDRARAQLALGRFEREAKATAQLSSAHTIRVFDFGRGPNDSFFYVMELLDGLDLFSLVQRHGAQPQARVHHILMQACDSLAEAHDQGMVHRDIKPANLFLCRKGKTLDHVKVLDFGLVRSDPGAKPDGVDTLPRLTRQGIISGSPAFMSPEQAEGADNLDRRADIYALGCVGYYLLTGSEPFSHDNPMIVLMQQVNQPVEPMAKRRRGLVLEPEFEALIMRMLAKNRDERPSSADEVARALRRMRLSQTWNQDVAEQWWSTVKEPVVVEAAFDPDDQPTHRLIRYRGASTRNA
ncbi:MAG: serine/threonine-protein kinase, partial [Myxococcota bacterium]